MQDQQSSSGDRMSGALEMTVERLANKYHGVFSHETVARAVHDSRDRLLEQATVISPFMPTLIEHFAGDQLRAAALVQGLVAKKLPQPLTDVVVRAADVVITMGCGEACPIYPGKRYEDWEVADPAAQPLEVVRGIRDEIRRHVEELLGSLPTHLQAPAGTAP